jgi:nitroreductase
MNHETITSALNWRYATKNFDTAKKISEKDWKTLEDSLVKSPSSFGLQPWKFLVIQTPSLRETLKPLTWGQSQVTDASHYVVFTALDTMDTKYIDMYLQRMAEVRKISLDSLKGYRDAIIGNLIDGPRAKTIQHWSDRQAYIAMGFLMETAALIGVDACPIEGLDPVQYDEVLQLKSSGYHTIAAVALGYRASTDKYASTPKVRFETSKVISYL